MSSLSFICQIFMAPEFRIPWGLGFFFLHVESICETSENFVDKSYATKQFQIKSGCFLSSKCGLSKSYKVHEFVVGLTVLDDHDTAIIHIIEIRTNHGFCHAQV